MNSSDVVFYDDKIIFQIKMLLIIGCNLFKCNVTTSCLWGGIQEANDSDILMLMQYVFYYVTLKAVNTASASERDAFLQTPSSHASVLYSNIYNINSI